jgi:hypothetical protein
VPRFPPTKTSVEELPQIPHSFARTESGIFWIVQLEVPVVLAGIVVKLVLADGAHPMIVEAHNITVRNRMNNFFKVLSPIVNYYCTFRSIPD